MPEHRTVRVLACVSPDVRASFDRELQHVLFAADITQALHALTHAQFDLVLIGMRFDESRGLELMQHVATNAAFSRVPIVGVRDSTQQRAVSQRAFEVPMRILGAREVVDLAALPRVLADLSPS